MFEEQMQEQTGASPLQQMGGKMSPEEIIRAAAPRQAPGVPVDKVLQSIQQETQLDGSVFEQFGNTVFAAHPTPTEGAYLFRALNADSPQNYMKNTLQFFSVMQREYGATMLVTTFTDPAIINIAKGIARAIQTDENLANDRSMEYVVTKKPDGTFQMNIKLRDGI